MKCVGFPAYDNCNECELTSLSCHPQQLPAKEKKKESIISEIKGWFHFKQLDGLHSVLMEAGTLSCYDLGMIVDKLRKDQDAFYRKEVA